MAKIIWSKEARDDLEEIYLQLLNTSPYFANVWVDEIMKMAIRLESFPQLGRVVPETRINRLRECIVRQYRMIYEVPESKEIVEILAIRHSSKPLSNF
jgi:plasmid stabilization system protein ParE